MERSPPQPASPPQPPVPSYGGADDEISLYELWDVLVRRRVLIAITALAVLLAAVGYHLLQTPTYSMDLVLSVGDRPSSASDEVTAFIERPEALESRLNEVVIPVTRRAKAEGASENGGAVPFAEAELIDHRAGLVRLFTTVTAADQASAQALLNAVAEVVVNEHAHRLGSRREALRDQIAALQIEAERLEGGVALGQLDLSAVLGAERGAASAAVLNLFVDAMLSDRRESELARRNLALRELEATLAETSPTVVARPAQTGGSQGRSLGLMVALGAVLGLMLGVFAAFAREFAANAAAHRSAS